MKITVAETNVMAVGILDLRPVDVLAPLTRSRRQQPHLSPRRPRQVVVVPRQQRPALRRRPVIAPSRTRLPAVTSGDTVVVTVVRPPRYGAGGGPRARPAAKSSS
jgi:hypothetical protein